MSINKNKLSLYLILGIPLLGILATTAFYFYISSQGVKLGSQNRGILLSPPKQIGDVKLTDKDGQAYTWYHGESKWTFMVAGTAECDAACRKKLLLVRQIHKALGKHSLRIDTVYLNLDGHLAAQTAELFAREFPRLHVLTASANEVQAWSGKQPPAIDLLTTANFYVLDPAGWMMMYYTDAHGYKDVIKDMKFLLNNS